MDDMTTGSFEQHDVRLEGGGFLPSVTTAWCARGRLAADGRNAILVAHGYTGGPQGTIARGSSVLDGSLAALIGPGRAIDTDRWWVLCPNALGSSFGSTNAASPDPAGRPWGSRFPAVSVGDIVSTQRALLEHLGVRRLAAVVGVSFGGLQALQWGMDHPDLVGCVVAALCAPRMPGVDPDGLQRQLDALPGYDGGDHQGRADLRDAMFARRVGTLRMFGADAVLARDFDDPAEREAELQRLARAWADVFDPNSLLILFRTMAAFDATPRLRELRAPLLYALCRSDKLVPPTLASAAMEAFRAAGIEAKYHEIASDLGHCGAGDAAAWSDVLASYLDRHAR